MIVVVVIVVVAIFALVLAVALRSRSSGDGVDSFRRQIDALSPEARRPTVDQVKSVEREAETDDPDDEP